ncbi:TIR-like protein DUF1863 [Novosphingobium kunmingense]|uniref:TIR-like protein DUF1863 n=1 Tax=Novosphingobium kunmingense TaxID=1211806 RepID=A0A2N0H6A0_9SPHN|nr:toll/interleukin-1 receptor domain-containing protein [Novosphingobium kunmingense]PKB14447.1 TIR-like protein DUF1863 [Novosphingobium kunmingense]
MTGAAIAPAGSRYQAFISYSHADDRFATWLHRRIERFVVPAADSVPAKRLAPVFLDRAELAAGADLSAQVKDALEQSAALIVVCSPAAVLSRWVAQEIALFRDRHPERPVLAALIDGDPGEAFPAPLLQHGGRDFEPLAADFRKSGDGRRLALLKIVAGLTALPLDRLVQRDAQARQRRVMAVTAAAIALSVVLASLLLVALRQRAEAQRQRAEAEGMVEFMLTDLRDRLRSVGRLEIMDAVNEKAMDHYEGDRNLEDLPPDMLQRRARLLTAMGEDDIAAGHEKAADAKFRAAYRLTGELLARDPAKTERIFHHAQSEYWMGSLPYARSDRAATRPHWEAYNRLALQLVELEPAKADWQREVFYSEANLCALAQLEPADLATARQHCAKASAVSERLSRAEPTLIQTQLDHLNNLGWLADVERKSGNLDRAVDLRRQQQVLVERLASRFPDDVRPVQYHHQVLLGLAQALAARGDHRQAVAIARRGLEISQALRRTDPTNNYWLAWHKQLEKLIATSSAAARQGENR